VQTNIVALKGVCDFIIGLWIQLDSFWRTCTKTLLCFSLLLSTDYIKSVLQFGS